MLEVTSSDLTCKLFYKTVLSVPVSDHMCSVISTKPSHECNEFSVKETNTAYIINAVLIMTEECIILSKVMCKTLLYKSSSV